MMRYLFLSAILVPAMASATRAAITFGQFDDFQSGDTMGWSQGGASPNPPSVVPTGGPAGAGDQYLQNISSGTVGPGGKQTMFNEAQWTGDFNAAGVTRVTAQMANFGSTPLSMRFVLEGGPNFSEFVSTNAFPLPPDKTWHLVIFDLTPSAMTLFSGTDSLAAELGSISSVRLVSAKNPSARGDAVAATLGVDDIRALTDQGDFNFDGSVGFDDLLLLAQDYGQKVSTADGAVAAAVPEPTAALPVALAMTGLTRRRRTR